MTDNGEFYKRLYEEEQRRRKKAEQGQQEEQRRREEAETQTRPTTLPQYLDACHVHLQSGLAV